LPLGLILGVFAAMILAELPDKTMIATLLLGSKYRPVDVWLGATAAFIIHVALAVAVGQAIHLLPHRWVEAITALLFAGGAIYLLVVDEDEEVEVGEEEVAEAPRGLRPFATTFVVIFVGEFGDLTQLLTANLAAKYHDPWAVFVGAVAGLTTVAALAAFGGRFLVRYLPLKVIRKVSGVLLGAFALVSIYQAFL
jgi:putative Ca2+/H+ antiporter (TMEM165/GDT1 family)